MARKINPISNFSKNWQIAIYVLAALGITSTATFFSVGNQIKSGVHDLVCETSETLAVTNATNACENKYKDIIWQMKLDEAKKTGIIEFEDCQLALRDAITNTTISLAESYGIQISECEQRTKGCICNFPISISNETMPATHSGE